MAWPRLGLAVAWGSIALSLLAVPWISGAPTAWLLAPWAASVLLLGLPHGALDPFVPFQMRGEPLDARRFTLFCAVYLGIGGVVIGLWLLAPVAAAAGFIVLTWAHWGQGDVFFLRAIGWDGHLTGRAHLALAGAVRGSLPMVVPLAAQPEGYAAVLGGLVRLFEPAAEVGAVEAVVSASGAARVGLALLFGGYVLWSVVSAARRGAWRSLAIDLGEVAGLALFFAVLPPLWSVGVYFCAWHALRHLARLEPVVAPRQPGRFALLATPFTLGALVLFAGLGWLLTERPEASDLLAVYLVGIASVTVPHVLVVAWMDARQGVWRA
ncbi:MAG: Brp/Blh family beta-carotene 15,15'-dioxygenase [Bacteroidota bacterium]